MTRIAVSLLLVVAFIQTAAFIEIPSPNHPTNMLEKESTPRTVWRRTVNGWENMNDWNIPKPEAEIKTVAGYQANTAIMNVHPAIVACSVLLTSLISFMVFTQQIRERVGVRR